MRSFAIFLPFLLIFASPAVAEKNILAIIPLTGDSASIGTSIKDTLLFALDDLPESEKKDINIIIEDDQLKSDRAVSALRRVLTKKKIDVAINFSSGTSHALAPILENAKIPLISISSDPKVSKGRSYVVNFWVTPSTEAAVLIPELQKRNIKTIARVITTQQGALAVNDAFDEENKGRIKIAIDENFPPEVRDFSPILSKIKATPNIDAIQTVLLPGQLGIFAKQAREQKIPLPITGFEIHADRGEVIASEGALVGQFYVDAALPDEAFLKRFSAQHPESSLYAVPITYDAFNIMVTGLKDQEGINHFLHNVKDFKGVSGVISATGDNRFTLPAAIKIVEKP